MLVSIKTRPSASSHTDCRSRAAAVAGNYVYIEGGEFSYSTGTDVTVQYCTPVTMSSLCA